MKILIIGGGGREHALAWKLAQSPRVGKIYIAPGNAGTAQLGKNVTIAATDISKLVEFARSRQIDFTVVGMDDALAAGVVDAFQKAGLRIFGPTRAAAQIEASKVFAKNLMRKQGIPTAKFQTFSDYTSALSSLPRRGEGKGEVEPTVIKASGLALGKGVTVCKTLGEARLTLKKIMVDKIFGDAGNEVVIEEYLEGPEISIHAFCDGKNYAVLPSSQDHKPVGDGDTGPNTGGMGAIAPVPWVKPETMDLIAKQIVEPALQGLNNVASPFMGLLYPGLKITPEGPRVVEFNARFGDPECQAYMRLLKTDLLDILEACADGKIKNTKIEWRPGFACCIALASGGYPGKYEKGKEITGIEEAEKLPGIVVFHAGTAPSFTKRGRGGVLSSGGRVLGVSAVGDTLKQALDRAYEAIKLINFEGMHYRSDIGRKSLYPSPLAGEGARPPAGEAGRADEG